MQFTGFRTQQFNAIILVILERIEKLKVSSIWSSEAEDIVDKIAPIELGESGEQRIDVENGLDTLKAEMKKLRDIFEYIDLARSGVAHELEAMNLLGKMGHR